MPAVARSRTYLGEIPLYLDFKMKDLERVEVLIGPQGTLYGEGTLGGCGALHSEGAEHKGLQSGGARQSVYALSHSDSEGYKADVVVNAPIVEDKVAFRAAIGYTHDPGFIDYPYLVNQPGVSNPQPDLNDPVAVAANLHRQNDVDWEHTLSSRLALLWSVSNNVGRDVQLLPSGPGCRRAHGESPVRVQHGKIRVRSAVRRAE